jgi:mono/diheme cytochrome c family protein
LVLGQQLYDQQCALCHGSQGQGAASIAINNTKITYSHSTKPTISLSLVNYIDQYMGALGDPTKCTIANSCAAPVAAYIQNNYSTLSVKVVTEAERLERVTKGETFYRNPRINCIVCHGNDGTKTVGNGKSLENCGVCTSWTALRDYIDEAMPPAPEGGNAETGPFICTVANECASYTADWIWNKVNNWALTPDGGVKVETENRFGQDTLRIKSYEMLKADFTRIFGAVPTNLAASATAFKASPKYWYDEPEMGAVSLNVLANAAVQSCNTETLPAITPAALRTSCADWARRMWLREATAAELDSCVAVGMEDTTTLPAKERAVFTCVSMMISLPALAY